MKYVVAALAMIGALTVLAGLAYAEGYAEGMIKAWWDRRRT